LLESQQSSDPPIQPSGFTAPAPFAALEQNLRREFDRYKPLAVASPCSFRPSHVIA
jgi:hypothetical protein